MAVYNEILSGRFNKALQKLFSIKGPPPVPQLGSEILAIQNLPFGVEHRYLLSEARFAAISSQTGAAGQFVAYRFRNPSNSGVVATVEKIQIASANQQQIAVDLSSVNALGDFGAILATQRMDARLGSTAQSSLTNTLTSTKTIALGPTILLVGILANTTLDLILTEDQELPILPGDALGIGNSVAATSLTLGIWWRERVLEESERI